MVRCPTLRNYWGWVAAKPYNQHRWVVLKMQEVWKFHDNTFFLICEWVASENYVFTVKPADLEGVGTAKALMKLSAQLRSIGLNDRGIYRVMPKILAEAPGWHLANQKVWQPSDDRLRY